MDWVLDPRVWVPLVIAIITFVGGWSVYKQKTDAHDSSIRELKDEMSELKDGLGKHETSIALLKKDHEQNSGAIKEIVDQLKDVVRDLQRVAIKLAIGEYGKT